ncbi:MAG: RNA methyltransferase [Actinobacteria bacterium]|nr:RNA methyltransferase [Actinomycetota bacterium]MCG2802295.1 RNA methyltransferase [Cellulomonas sp.]
MVNPRADRVRQVHALATRSARERSGRFLVEGPQAVREAVACTGVRVHAVYLTEAAYRRYPEIVGAARDRSVPVRLGTVEVLAAMSPDAQGVVAVADLVDVSLDHALMAGPRLVAVLAQVRDPGNAGTVLRAADAAGADLVVLTQASVDVHNPKSVRSSAGSLFHLPVVVGVSLVEAVAALRRHGLGILAASGDGRFDLDDLLDGVAGPGAPDLAAPTAWVFGNEAWGLADADRAAADAVVRVPLHGRAESLNLATAAAVCLYASARAQRR